MRPYFLLPAAPLFAALLLSPLAFAACAPAPLQAGPLVFHPRPAPPAPVQGPPAPSAYKAGTPERALAEFLAAWHGKNFAHMAQATGITWKHSDPAPVQALRTQFTPFTLVGARIVGPGQDARSPAPAENIVNLRMTLRYRSGARLHTQTLSATVLREIRPLVQDRRGTWGVDPEFTVALGR